jgi:hypothetical protein
MWPWNGQYYPFFFGLSLASRLFHLLARMDHCLRLVPLPVVNNTRKQWPSRRSARNINTNQFDSPPSLPLWTFVSRFQKWSFKKAEELIEFGQKRRINRWRIDNQPETRVSMISLIPPALVCFWVSTRAQVMSGSQPLLSQSSSGEHN